MQQRQAPCPQRCFDDLGSAFALGCVGGSAFHFFKGMRNAPQGFRTVGGYQQVVLRAPALGGSFAMWGGLFSAFECSISSVRQKEDPLNAISAGFFTGGVLAARAGPKAALLNAAIGGLLLGLIEGMSFLFGRLSEGPAAPPPVPGMSKVGGSPFGGSSAAPSNLFASLQPTRSLTTTLDDPTAQFLTLDDEDQSQFQSTSATLPEGQHPAPKSLFATKTPVYAAAVEFSTDDFAFNDTDDFDDDQQ